jgi:N-acetylglucosamine-6-phosphate deacetylase
MVESIAKAEIGTTNFWITHAKLPGYEGLQQVWVNQQGKLQAIQPLEAASPAENVRLFDLAGDWLSLGGVDLQINGALGLAFPDLSSTNCQKLAEICQFLWHQGIDSFLPTIVTTAIPKIQQALATFANFPDSGDQRTAKILGLHLEGPFLNPQKRGAHPAEYLLPLSVARVRQVLGEHASQVKVMTLAPELDPSGEAIAYLRSQNIIVSLGHSLATAAQAQQAFAQGASMVTHAFNAMPGLHHREPGLLGAAIVDPRVWCGLIADGEHVCPLMLDLLLRTSWEGSGFFLVSDALAPLGLADGLYAWDSRQIEVKKGTARLSDRTLAGTTLSLLTGVQNLVYWGICSVETAIALATEAPRKALGLPGLSLGQPATHLLRWHQDVETGELTWCRLFSSC